MLYSKLEKDFKINRPDKEFKHNFDQMKNKGAEKNNAKVFEVDKFTKEISLWEPVAEFIIDEYNKVSKYL